MNEPSSYFLRGVHLYFTMYCVGRKVRRANSREPTRTRWSTGLGLRNCFAAPEPRWKVTVTRFCHCRVVKDDMSLRLCYMPAVPVYDPRSTWYRNLYRVLTFDNSFVCSFLAWITLYDRRDCWSSCKLVACTDINSLVLLGFA